MPLLTGIINWISYTYGQQSNNNRSLVSVESFYEERLTRGGGGCISARFEGRACCRPHQHRDRQFTRAKTDEYPVLPCYLFYEVVSVNSLAVSR